MFCKEFLIGMGVGGGATGLLLWLYFRKKMEDEISAFKEYYRRRENQKSSDLSQDLEVKEEIQKLKEVMNTPENFENDDTDDEYEEILQKHEYSENKERFTIIGEQEFYTNAKDYGQETVYFYDEDDVLTFSDDSVIGDIEDTIGYSTLAQFLNPPEDEQPDIIYVRNNQLKMEFEIIRKNLSYSRDVLGMEE